MLKISEPKKYLVKEHQRLVRVLKSGNKKAQIKEAQKQDKELKGYIKKKMCSR